MSITHAKAEILLHKASTRGFFDFGWLQTYHSFSFSSFYNPHRMNFGALRVLNDDTVAAKSGFGMHDHRNMEIVSIPLQGKLQHEDSEGNKGTLGTDEVQVMSAGTGITHSEKNASKEEPVSFLQIWIIPKVKDTTPSYRQLSFDSNGKIDQLQLLVSEDGRENSLQIGQEAFISRIQLVNLKEFEYNFHNKNNQLYVFVIEGEITINGNSMERRDGACVFSQQHLNIQTQESADLLFIEVTPNIK